MKGNIARLPIYTLEMIYQHSPLHPFYYSWKSEWVGLSLTGERTDDNQTTGAIVAPVRQHQGRSASGLFTARLRIKIQPHDIPGFWNVGSYHSMDSLPLSGPVAISS